jgi:RimJ/RimL family protein N-acetyltransferase
LLRRVVEIAKDEKVEQLFAEMMPDNIAMRMIVKRLGFRLRATEDPTSDRAFLDL